MLTYEEFERTIIALQDNYDRLGKITEVLDWDNAFELSMADEVIHLLGYIFKDTGRWLEYWVYERDFGRDWYGGCAQEADGTDIDLSSMRKLYNFLLEVHIKNN